MAEIKHTFTAGRMNKDLDERLVPNGEYRDALNIQVRTTEGGAAGTVQNLEGNSGKGLSHLTTNFVGDTTKCIGSVADERNNKGYFLFASPRLSVSSLDSTFAKQFYVDSIIEQDSDGSYKPVVVDIFGIAETTPAGFTSLNSHTTVPRMPVTDTSIYRVGMTVKVFTFGSVTNLATEGTKIAKLTSNAIYFDRPQSSNWSTSNWFSFEAPKALEFDYNSRVTGINVIDDFLFYTDNSSEPKKINIRRSKAGTVSPQTTVPNHTKLILKNKNGVLQAGSDYVGTVEPVTKDHFTVIRKAPRTAPSLKLKSSAREGSTEYTITGKDFTTGGWTDDDGVDFATIPIGDVGVDLQEGDHVELTCLNDTQGLVSTVRGIYHPAGADGALTFITLLSISSDTLASHTDWLVELIQPGKPLFELKFPRFAFRYKYNDNEYSSFSPWSELAFIPGKFDYDQKKGHNLGMTNLLREVTITNLLQDTTVRPDDIKSIDILYKSTDSPNVYVAKTIEKGVDPEWSDISTSTNSHDIVITSEMIHKTVPSDQILRSWDNVPRLAKAQEIVGNRLIYGNYTQGYDMPSTVSINQSMVSKDITTILNPEKSIKSLRSYRLGLIIGDGYGRETPVISVGTRNETNPSTTNSYSNDSTSINKSEAVKSNSFLVTQDWANSQPDNWMDYAKYYIKETSSEYYNLVMDRWYDADDGNVWVSFPSAERNKVDEETYLILKKKHGENSLVESEARYKIIAIENEAPEFIKLDMRLMGSREMDSDQMGLTGNVEHLKTSSIFELSLANFSSFFNDSESEGTLKVRVKAVTSLGNFYTSYREVSRLSKPNSDLSIDGSINIVRPFGDEANFPTILVDTGVFPTVGDATGDLEYFLEFLDEVVVNKPEFDGRFFVKLQRDFALIENILKPYGSNANYTSIQSFRIGYIDTGSFNNPATSGPKASYNFNGFGHFTTSSDLDEFRPIYNSSDGQSVFNSWWNQTNAFWQSYSSQMQYLEVNGGEGVVGFIDAADHSDGDASFSGEFPFSESERGLTKSGDNDVDSSTYDRLYISCVSGSGSISGTPFDNLRYRLTEVGTLFRFGSDSNTYMVVSGSSTDDYLTSMYNLSTNPISNNARTSFYTTFRRVDSNGLLTNEGIDISDWDPRGQVAHDGSEYQLIEIVDLLLDESGFTKVDNKSAIFETEPKDSVDLDLYYEASNAIPLRLTNDNTSEFAPLKSKVSLIRNNKYLASFPDSEVKSIHGAGVLNIVKTSDGATNQDPSILVNDVLEFTHVDGTKTRSKVKDWITLASDVPHSTSLTTRSISAKSILPGVSSFLWLQEGTCESNGLVSGMILKNNAAISSDLTITVISPSASFFSIGTTANNNNIYDMEVEYSGSVGYSEHVLIDLDAYKYQVELPWFNCYSYGNGVESNRIRDDFNTPFINNGVKVSSTVDDYQEENRYNSLIFSNIYNANSSVNGLNEFNMSQKITKDLNPSYGKIQALKTRDTDVTVFTEDKVLRVLANKDALFNADGSTNVTASDRVLGQAVPYVGDYGISNNPESLAFDQYRMYFTDKQRGAVLRLSRDGLTPISSIGMNSWFRDHLTKSSEVIGSFDKVNGEYNVSISFEDIYQLSSTTVSFNEQSKGWVSFKTFIQESGQSFGGKYFTAKQNKAFEHYSGLLYNNFYGVSANSSINIIMNDIPGTVKNFEAINYEGSEGYRGLVNNSTYVDSVTESAEYSDGVFDFMISSSGYTQITKGWKVSSIITDMESGNVGNFSSKEGKWFGYISGDFDTSNITVDTGDFATQGLGTAESITVTNNEFEIIIQQGPE